jgi:hypothetical protein
MTRNINNCDGLPAPLALAVKEFDGWSAEHFGKLDIHNSIDAPLYHYTDAAGLEGIIKSQEIWFSSHAHLNDPGEITYGMKIASKILKEIGAESDPRINVFCELTNDLFTKENLTQSFGFYIACFSRAGDDLGQWRGYGANGRGFSLGLAQHLFHVTPIRDEALPPQFVTPVVYGIADGRQRHFPAICEAVKIVGKAIEQSGDIMRDRSVWLPFLRCMAEALMVQLLFNSLVIKHEAYQNRPFRCKRMVRLLKFLWGPRRQKMPKME